MGTPKALLLFDGEPLIVHIVATLRASVCRGRRRRLARPGSALDAGHAGTRRSGVSGAGRGTLLRAQRRPGEVSFVTVLRFGVSERRPDLTSRLADAEHDVVVPHWQGRFQPLHAVYRRSVLPLLEEQLARGELRPVYLFDRVRTRRIDEEEIRRFDPEGSSFFNMNTPEDYAEALEALEHARRRRPDPDRPRFSARSSCSGSHVCWRKRGRWRSGCPRARRSRRS